MKKTYIIASFLTLLALYSNAQNTASTQPQMGRSSFGIYGGVNFQNINGFDNNNNKLTNALVTKFHVGINQEIAIAPDFYFQVGIQYLGKGCEGQVPYKDNSGTYTIIRNLSLNYLEVPFTIVNKPIVGSGNLILGFGPYIGYALNGKATYSGTNAPAHQDIQFVSTVPTNDSNNLVYYKRLDIGANFMVGYQFQNRLFIILNSQLGLVPINAQTTTDLINKNTGFGFSLGYRF